MRVAVVWWINPCSLNSIFRSVLLIQFVSMAAMMTAQHWCPPGAEWRYPYISQLHPEQGTLRYTYMGDSLYQGELCQHFVSRAYFPDQTQWGPWHSFTTTAPGVIRFWNTLVSQFDTLVNFDAVPGTGWSFIGFQSQEYFITVQDTGISMIDGIPLRYLVITSDTPWFGLPPDTIYERIGALGLHNFDPLANWFMESPTLNGIGCYRDEVMEYLRPFPSSWLETPCDIALSEVESQHELATKLQVHPNPGSDRVYFTVPSDQPSAQWWVSVLDARGALVLDERLVDPRAGMDVGNIPPGLYTIALRDRHGRPHHVKWVRE